MHRVARFAALIAGLALGAVSMVALVTRWTDDFWDVFGIFAANNWTALAWGTLAAALLLVALLGRTAAPGHTAPPRDTTAPSRDPLRPERDAAVPHPSDGARRFRRTPEGSPSHRR